MSTKKLLPDYINLNQAIRPENDFYSHVCSRWNKDHPVPAGSAGLSILSVVADRVDRQVRQIIDECLVKERLPTDQRQLVTFYNTLLFKDEHLSRSLQTLRTMIKEIQNFPIADRSRETLLGLVSRYNVWAFMDFGVMATSFNSRQQLAVSPANLPLGWADYYDRSYSHLSQAYLRFLKKQKDFLKTNGIVYEQDSKFILSLETILAGFHEAEFDANDLKQYDQFSWRQLNRAFNQFDWPAYFEAAGLTPQKIIVIQSNYLKHSLNHLNKLTAAELKQYMIHLLVLKYNCDLSVKMDKIRHDFFDQQFQEGYELKTVKDKLCQRTNYNFTDTIGRIYVQKYLKPEIKVLAEEINALITVAFKDRLQANQWLSIRSRLKAQKKLAGLVFNIGYRPEAWRDYSAIKLTNNNPVENTRRIYQVFAADNWALLKTKRNRWAFSSLDQNVQDVFAWVNCQLLTVNYSAGYLQAPYCDHKLSLAYNLGSLGGMIGHEICHHFDGYGQKLDYRGRPKACFSKKEQAIYAQLADKLIAIAAKKYPIPKQQPARRKIQEEFIADLVGLEVALTAAKTQYKLKPKSYKNALRAVFIGYAYSFAYNSSDKLPLPDSRNNTHPIQMLRVNGVVSHCDDFYYAFDVQPDSKLYLKPADRIKIL